MMFCAGGTSFGGGRCASECVLEAEEEVAYEWEGKERVACSGTGCGLVLDRFGRLGSEVEKGKIVRNCLVWYGQRGRGGDSLILIARLRGMFRSTI